MSDLLTPPELAEALERIATLEAVVRADRDEMSDLVARIRELEAELERVRK
jgi:hypothetical protein